jgi:hypothetical protein
MEPRRLWRRYLFGNAIFIFLVFKQWWKQSINDFFSKEKGRPVSESEE